MFPANLLAVGSTVFSHVALQQKNGLNTFHLPYTLGNETIAGKSGSITWVDVQATLTSLTTPNMYTEEPSLHKVPCQNCPPLFLAGSVKSCS